VELDRATQQNARLVEQTATAIASLRERADGLAERVGRFRIADAAGEPEPNAGARRRARPGQ
jgi:methyl-accepting chemotaxis protein